MRVNLAASILALLGPGRVLHDGAADAGVLSELLLAGCDAWSTGPGAAAHPRWLQPDVSRPDAAPLDMLLLELAPGQDFAERLCGAIRLHGVPRVIALHAPGFDRAGVETTLISAGWRRHPAALTVERYPDLRDDVLGGIELYQPVPAAAAVRWPVAALQRERPLHMDMLRESGCRADAHVVRYALAAQWIRAGDSVLDCACGLGYGTAVMAALSRGGEFLGVDLDPNTVEYAQANYAGPGIRFAAGDAAALRGIPDASVDVVVSMETIEHVPDWHGVIAEFRRVLKPGGRLVASVPDRWVDETGQDPNPYHEHAFDWAGFSEGLARCFIIETRFAQSAPGGFKLPDAPRALYSVPLDPRVEVEAEWLLAVASVDPTAEGQARRDAFRHPAFGAAFEASGADLVAFGRDYDNPYLYRSMVQIGERLADPGQLVMLAGRVAATARPGSADLGAAICVLGYRALEERHPVSARAALKAITAYVAGPAPRNAHALRWHVSLCFLAGRIAALLGDRDAAVSWYRRTAASGWRDFSPILATKPVAAAFHEGVLHLASNDIPAARECFQRGVSDALDAARGDARDIICDPSAPIPFGLTELAEVMDMGSQCANALYALPLWSRDRGLFWRQVDVKRFGLLTWSWELIRANAELMRRNRELEGERRQAVGPAVPPEPVDQPPPPARPMAEALSEFP